MTPNKELAARVLRQITEHPETHRQATWFEKVDEDPADRVGEARDMGTCGTVGCVAGWAVVLHYADKKRVADREELIEFAAQRLLGLSWPETWWLFDVDRHYSEVVEALQRIVDGEPVYPETVSA